MFAGTKSTGNKHGRGEKKKGYQPYALDKQIEQDKQLKPIKTKKRAARAGTSLDDDDHLSQAANGDATTMEAVEEVEMPKKMAKKIMKAAKSQRLEEMKEANNVANTSAAAVASAAGNGAMSDDEDGDDDDEFDEIKEDDEDGQMMDEEEEDDEDLEGKDGDYITDVQVTEEDEQALALFGGSGPVAAKKRTLGEIIQEKLAMQEQEKEEARLAKKVTKGLDPQLAEMYRNVGTVLKRFTSGKLPKAFKVLPSLSNWEELMYLTRPDEWSPHAMLAGVKIFVSTGTARATQRFFRGVLLPCAMEHMHEHKKLHFALYLAVKRALYRPTAFYKGFLLPLCEEGECTLREATILASILSKATIPMLHSAAALMRLTRMKYNAPTIVFIKALLDKKYSLPFRVIDTLCSFFTAFASLTGKPMVVLWHQSLLVFVQRYKMDFTPPQRDAIKALIKVHTHPIITTEIRYELDSAAARVTPSN